MIRLYCNKHHGGKGELCTECDELLAYARMRLDKCLFQENKTTCGKCLIHCYKPEMKTKVKLVMRYSGPRLLLHHPILALHHVKDGFKKPEKTRKTTPKRLSARVLL